MPSDGIFLGHRTELGQRRIWEKVDKVVSTYERNAGSSGQGDKS